uniref:Ion transport domain-containing protein n=1 Tax=Anguilla anguilla TaxID=7936 RepID=A0A0E9WYR8_ANGAN
MLVSFILLILSLREGLLLSSISLVKQHICFIMFYVFRALTERLVEYILPLRLTKSIFSEICDIINGTLLMFWLPFINAAHLGAEL